jgi:4-hydroxybenzoate polyprenyltransferase
VSPRERLPPLLRLLRPQWTKNLAALAGVIFGGRITEPGSVLLDLLVVLVFVAASSATYVFNDLRDVAYDRQHPTRRLRPLAAGEVDRTTASRLAAALAAGALLVALCLGAKAVLIGRAYAYGLGAAGGAGVSRTIDILRSGIVRTMKLLGSGSVRDLDRSFVKMPAEW